MKKKYGISNYDYSLPKELIAQHPAAKRGGSRLLVAGRGGRTITHAKFSSITDYFRAGDCLVLNDTKVIPARLYGKTEKTGAKIEILLLSEGAGGEYEVMMRNSRRVSSGDKIIFSGGLSFITGEKSGKTVKGHFSMKGRKFRDNIERYGVMPLPPYIKQGAEKKVHRKRYQTVFARKEGAKAAPTAGLHFTKKIISQLKKKGVKVAAVTLHVGYGTFEEVAENDIRDHKMHSEYFEIKPAAASVINNAVKAGKKVIACGTTSVRAVESAARNGKVLPGSGSTGIYIYPGYEFRIISGLITNFHLPRTTLLALVYAFGGEGTVKRAYKEAIERKYRLFSYGDAMLIV